MDFIHVWTEDGKRSNDISFHGITYWSVLVGRYFGAVVVATIRRSEYRESPWVDIYVDNKTT